MRGDAPPPEPTLDQRIEVALEHLRLMVAYETESDIPGGDDAELRACRALRGQMPLYIKGYNGAAQLRDRLTRCSTMAEFEDLLRAFALTHEPARSL